jgi:hypothetical protein
MASGGGGRSRRFSVTLPERREHMNAVIRAERTATKITHVAPLLIPGVLQTYDVMRAIMVAGGVDESEIDERVNDRLGRRHLITRRNPAHLTVLLGEAAIRQCIGGRQAPNSTAAGCVSRTPDIASNPRDADAVREDTTARTRP